MGDPMMIIVTKDPWNERVCYTCPPASFKAYLYMIRQAQLVVVRTVESTKAFVDQLDIAGTATAGAATAGAATAGTATADTATAA